MTAKERDEIAELVASLVDSCADNLAVNHIEGHDLPDKRAVESALDMLLNLLFPGYASGKALSPDSLPYYFGSLIVEALGALDNLIERALAYDCRQRREGVETCRACDRAKTAALGLVRQLPRLRQILKDDVQAAHDRDPAGESLDQIIFCYPGIEAIATQRLAHALYQMGVPIIPRMWTERAHSRTGIDIHPGASIGRRFFIDHGTGVVVGETTTIGDDVTLYQGVTLGALSPAKGQSLRGVKRHPTIGNGVIVYAGATILGGETVVGDGSTIGGSVWLTESTPPGVRVMMKPDDLTIRPAHRGTGD